MYREILRTVAFANIAGLREHIGQGDGTTPLRRAIRRGVVGQQRVEEQPASGFHGYEDSFLCVFYGYWRQPLYARYAPRGTGINTTFYFQDNGPGIARLTYVKNGHRIEPPQGVVHPDGRSVSEYAFNAWCESLEKVTIYPKAGDCVLFFSHIPHQGAKDDPNVERSNIVVHYQNNPFYEGIAHVSRTRPFAGSFPLAKKRGSPAELRITE